MKDESRGMKWFCSGLCVLIFFILHPSSLILAQDEPPPKKVGVQLMFIPPPMEGTVSLGIYDATGKLVRVLHAESPQTEFTAALNGLITFWDGKDDAEKMMAAGKYRAHGYVVGAMDFEGVAFLGNDWITDGNSPRVQSFDDLRSAPGDMLLIGARAPDGSELSWYCDARGEISGGVMKKSSAEVAGQWKEKDNIPQAVAEHGKIHIFDGQNEREISLPAVKWAVGAARNRDGGVWVIDCGGDQCEVVQYSPAGEPLRRLAIQSGDPIPWQIAASKNREAIYLLENNIPKKIWRVRGLELVKGSEPSTDGKVISTWKVFFSKTITSSGTLDAVRDLLKFPGGQPFVAQENIALRLLPNPLEQDKPGAVDISIGVDAKGSFLKACDGLPLCRVSETPNLRWAAMAREPDSKAITIFQSDGAVVEQFKASKLANMMAFDCGDFDFDPAKLK
jgi:hypothetical protein